MKLKMLLFFLLVPSWILAWSLQTGCSIQAASQRDCIDFSFDKLQAIDLADDMVHLRVHSIDLNINNLDIFLIQAKPWLLYNQRLYLEGELGYGFVEGGRSALSSNVDITTNYLPGKKLNTTLTVSGDIPRQDGRFFSLGLKAGCHFYPLEKLTLMPFVRLSYSEYNLRLPAYPSDTGNYANQFLHKYLKGEHFRIPWLTPALGLNFLYQIDEKSSFFFEVDCRHSALVSSYVERIYQHVDALGYGIAIGCQFKLIEQTGLSFEGSYEDVKARTRYDEATLKASRSSAKASLSLDFCL